MGSINLGTFTPTPGKDIQVPVGYNAGTVEIINDSPYLLIINLNGSSQLEAGGKQIYNFSEGGSNLIITAQVSYLSVPWATNTIVVNIYNPGELVGSNYPVNIYRGGYGYNVVSYYTKIQGVTTVTIALPVPPMGQQGYLTGFDFIATTKASGTSQVTVSFHNLVTAALLLDNNHITYYVVQNATNEIEIFRTFPQAVKNLDPTQGISCVVTNFDSATTGTLVMYGYIQ